MSNNKEDNVNITNINLNIVLITGLSVLGHILTNILNPLICLQIPIIRHLQESMSNYRNLNVVNSVLTSPNQLK